MTRPLKIVVPIVILAAGVLGFGALLSTKPEVESTQPEPVLPLVRVITVERQDVPLVVRAQGTVRPRTETTLVSQVSAEVVSVSPSFEVGGFFGRNDVLVELDDRDYQLVVEKAKAQVAQAELRLTEQLAEARVAQDEWRELGVGEPEPLALREPQIAEARAVLAAAKADLQRARLDLDRTVIRAPFGGRLAEKAVDVGQYVSHGQPLATVHAIDYAEVRLPIPHQELRFLDVPVGYRDSDASGPEPFVALTSNFTGRETTWPARIVRTEGEVDDKTRMIYLVARVIDPYGRNGDSTRPPFAVGLFVDAEIAGKVVHDAVLLPREALRDGEDRVLIVDEGDRLRYREVEVVRLQGEEAVIEGGSFGTGERVCISPLEVVVDGMRVRTLDVERPRTAAPRVAPPPAEADELPVGEAEAERSESPPASPEAGGIGDAGDSSDIPARLLRVELLSTDPTVVEVVVDRAFEYSYYRLPDPERLVVDLKGVVSTTREPRIEVGQGPVTRIRVGQNRLEPRKVSRIVFDLERSIKPIVERSESGLTVTLQE